MRQIKVILMITLSVFSKRLFIASLILSVFLSFRSIPIFSQGAILLSKEEYSKLPKVNWDTLRKYANFRAFSPRSTMTVKILNSPPIGDQGSEGSCQSWAAAYTALGILAYPKYNCWNDAKRSPNYVYNQIKGSGCSLGAEVGAALSLVTTQGSCAWELMPYIDGECTTQPNSAQILEASKNTAFQWAALSSASEVATLKQAIDLGYPVIIAFTMYQSFMDMWNYGGGIWTQPNSGIWRGYHAVCIVGYDDNQQMFKVQDQRGTTGGAQGFFWVSYNLVSSDVFSEAYILYGMNVNYVETISGPAAVCTSGSNYILNNLPPNTTISWQSSSNISVASTGTNTCTAYKISSGSGYIRALSNCGSVILANLSVYCDAFPNVTVTGQSGICPNSIYTYTAQVPGGHSSTYSYHWTYPYNWMMYNQYQNTATLRTPMYNPAAGTVQVSVTTCNGSSQSQGITVYPGSCTHYFTIYPNPAADNITIKMIDNATSFTNVDTVIINENSCLSASYDDIILTVRIYDNQSKLVSTVKRSGSSFSVPLTNMKDGTYIVEVSDSKTSYKQTMIVKHN